MNVCTYEPPAGLPKALAAAYNGTVPVAAALAALAATGGGADSKAEERGAAAGVVCLPPWKLFSKLSVWEASEPVPDPDEVRDRDELVAAAAEGACQHATRHRRAISHTRERFGAACARSPGGRRGGGICDGRGRQG